MNCPFFFSLPPAGHKIPITAVLRSVWGGRRVSSNSLLNPLRDFIGSRHLLYLSSGRAALWLIIKALSRINPGRSEVIIPAYTCPAVASAVLKAGLRPVLCDNNLTDFGFSHDDLVKKINENTLAVILVHLFGYPADILEVKKICRERNVFLVEDAAQAFGNSSLEAPNNKLGLLGDAGFFSFGRGKPISIIHGGIMVTKSEEILAEATKIYADLNHQGGFSNLKYGVLVSSYSALSNPYMYWIPQKIPFLHLGETIFEPDFMVSQGSNLAGYLIGRMIVGFDEEKGIRAINSEWYARNFQGISSIEQLPLAKFPYLRYPLLISEREVRDRVLNELSAQGTGAALFYPCPLNELPGLRGVLNDREVYPNAKKFSESLITLPVHSGVTLSIRNKIKSIIKKQLVTSNKLQVTS